MGKKIRVIETRVVTYEPDLTGKHTDMYTIEGIRTVEDALTFDREGYRDDGFVLDELGHVIINTQWEVVDE